MRLFLLPISTRRTLLYAQRLNNAAQQNQGLMDKVQNKAAALWAGWENKDSGWQKTIVKYGNQALRKIPYEEWGLKSVPPLSTKRGDDEIKGTDKVEVLFPGSLIQQSQVESVLQRLGNERESLHRKRLFWCFVGMPISAPFALVPIIPNIPFFYLAYRAWSHWRAISGGKHIQFLLQNHLLVMKPSAVLDEVYIRQNAPLLSTPDSTTKPGEPINAHPKMPKDAQPTGEMMLLDQKNGKKMTQALDLPQLEVELERAIWQVEQAIKKQNAEKDAADNKRDEPKSQ
ncbi:mitochondrial K+-H+ exchange-related-domain-containing protein [Coniella lustricola]|uniref:Mitochondrial K+-H+ exchange-related-domain-containing protein n=1 Tax=Coniella lustricola TaxID=2025994 RepID=A0A2T2ZZR0_9PEZI|nr:mitochondrial K+-H+ exchange-related-domain-containing protein [Coniella lustricola]